MLTLGAKEKLKNFEDPDGITTLYKVNDNLTFQLEVPEDSRPLTMSAKIESKRLSEDNLIDTKEQTNINQSEIVHQNKKIQELNAVTFFNKANNGYAP